MKFRKKPVIIDAKRWDPSDLGNAGTVVGWLMGHGCDFHHPSGSGGTTTLAIRTLEGEMLAQPGDWIIRGVQGEFYPCKPEIFDATYEPVEEPPNDAHTGLHGLARVSA